MTPAGFDRRQGRLFCDGVPLADLVERMGTPLYVYSRALVEERYRAYDRALAPVPHRICYALKANANGALLRILAGLGAGADVVSGFELKAALRAGFPADRIVFAGVGKTEDELALGLQSEIAEFNAESEEEIRRLGALAQRLGRVARVALRVNPDIDPRSHPYISTGLRENKFGVEIGAAPDVLRRARQVSGVEIVGLQCHLGSQMTDLGPLEESARALAALSRGLLDEGFALRTVNLGGGLGVDYKGGGVPDPAAFAARVLPALAGLPLAVMVEPGRSIVGQAGVLLTRVLYRKDQGGKRFLIVDAAMNDLLRPALYDAYHRIEPVTSRDRPSETVDVVGPICETGDFLARGRELPAVEVGELLAVRDVGAYVFCMSSNYNMRPRAAEVLVEAGGARLVRRRETFDDLVDTELSGEP